jgi:hypothetical protein
MLGTGIVMLAALPVSADPAPTQTPAQIEASGSVPIAPQMQKAADKAAALQSGNAKLAANAAAPATKAEAAAGVTGAVTDQQIQQKATIDNGRNDGGVAAQETTP